MNFLKKNKLFRWDSKLSFNKSLKKKNYFISKKLQLKKEEEIRFLLGKSFSFSFSKNLAIQYSKFTGISIVSFNFLLIFNGITNKTLSRFLTKKNWEFWEEKFFDFFQCTFIEWEYFRDQNLTRLQKLQCFKGKQQSLGLPSRGQRTHTNAQTSRWLKQKIIQLTKKI
jgi:ribosomal protein S13